MYESQKIEQQALPQFAALESAIADKFSVRTIRGRGHGGDAATVLQHGRCETARGHLPIQRHSAEPDLCGEGEDWGLVAQRITEGSAFVLDTHGCSFMLCHQTREHRILLRSYLYSQLCRPRVVPANQVRSLRISNIGFNFYRRSPRVCNRRSSAGSCAERQACWVHAGRRTVRSSGSFNITVKGGIMQGISFRPSRLLQSSDGWACGQEEVGASTRVGVTLLMSNYSGLPFLTDFR